MSFLYNLSLTCWQYLADELDIFVYLKKKIIKKEKKNNKKISFKNAVTVLCTFKFQHYHDLHNSSNLSTD